MGYDVLPNRAILAWSRAGRLSLVFGVHFLRIALMCVSTEVCNGFRHVYAIICACCGWPMRVVMDGSGRGADRWCSRRARTGSSSHCMGMCIGILHSRACGSACASETPIHIDIALSCCALPRVDAVMITVVSTFTWPLAIGVAACSEYHTCTPPCRWCGRHWVRPYTRTLIYDAAKSHHYARICTFPQPAGLW